MKLAAFRQISPKHHHGFTATPSFRTGTSLALACTRRNWLPDF